MTFPKPGLHLQSDEADGPQYFFGRYCLRPDGTLLRDAAVVPLPPKELQVLRILAASGGQIVSAQVLRDKVWGEVHVSADSLPRCISSLRSRLDPEDCIQTVYKQGYRFNLPVKQSPVDRGSGLGIERRASHITGPPRLAILPFTTADGVPEYFGPGIAEQVMLRLGRLRNSVADVVPRQSVFTLAGHGATALQIGGELRADLALTGALVALPGHFRVRVEMLRIADATQLWVEDFLLPRQLLACTDSQIARRIVSRIRDTFAHPIAASSPNPPSPSPLASHRAAELQREARRSHAYSVYMQACVQWSTHQRPQMQDAIRGFHQAIDLDDSLLSARLQLMHAYLAHSSCGYMRGDIAAELARKQAEILYSHSANGYPVHPAMGWIFFHHDRDFAAAAAAFARHQHFGYNPWNVFYQVRFALSQSRFAEAIALLRSAIEIDPYSSAMHGRLAWALHLSGDEAAAIEQAKHALALFPNTPSILFFCATVFAASNAGDKLENASLAINLAKRVIQSDDSVDAAHAVLAYAQARQGHIIEARDLLDRQLRLSRERFVMRSLHAPALVELGELDAAIDALTAADEQHCPWLFELLVDPRLRPLHGEAEFERLRTLGRKGEPLGASVA